MTDGGDCGIILAMTKCEAKKRASAYAADLLHDQAMDSTTDFFYNEKGELRRESDRDKLSTALQELSDGLKQRSGGIDWGCENHAPLDGSAVRFEV